MPQLLNKKGLIITSSILIARIYFILEYIGKLKTNCNQILKSPLVALLRTFHVEIENRKKLGIRSIYITVKIYLDQNQERQNTELKKPSLQKRGIPFCYFDKKPI